MARRQHHSAKTKGAETSATENGSRAHALWTGTLKLSLIAIPISVYPATNTSSDVRFRQLHRKCHTPIQLKKWCPHCEQEVDRDDIVKGYEVSRGQFALVDEEEIAKLRPESTRTIALSHVVDASAVEPVFIERSYFLSPTTKTAGSAFAVFREALGQQAAVGHMAIHGREYLVAVLAHDKALMAYTLRTQGEVRDIESVDGLEFAAAKTKPEEVSLARQVLGSLEHARDLTQFTDHYEDALKTMLAAKAPRDVVTVDEKGRGRGPNVVNLMDALRQSLKSAGSKAETARRPSPAKVVHHPSGRRHRRAS